MIFEAAARAVTRFPVFGFAVCRRTTRFDDARLFGVDDAPRARFGFMVNPPG
jgi:hypothetical protein